ncbi:CAP domain-containing protein [Micromonospora sp. NPDC051196]|uniref:CAP domain-containing protein n=1 Tax=Micromonospora sp. NPDC051196 TaxID=3155281 RepID=UPI00342AE72E
MHGWNDPLDPDGTRRSEPSTDDPAWLTDRPAPRSSYLFGDEPESSSDRWYHDQPTEQFRPHSPHQPAEPTYPGLAHPPGTDHEHTAGQHYRDTDWRADQHSVDRPARHAAPDHHRYDPAVQYHDTQRYHDTQQYADTQGYHETQGYHDTHGYQDTQGYADGQWHADRAGAYGVPGDDRLDAAGTETVAPVADTRPSRRRLSRPLVMGDAAAAATLVVSIGVAALALPGNETPTSTTAGERPVATGPALPEAEEPIDTFDSPSPSPSVSPSAATPSPSPSRTAKPTPASSRSSSAPSRQGTERQGSPSRGATATTSAPASPPTGAAASQAAQVVELVNAERAKAGCDSLSIDDKLTTAAQRHSQDQADHRNMSHTGSDGSDPGDRIDRVGYAWRTYGENVAWNQQTPAAVMDAWMNSPGHRANILNCAFTEIGVGVASSNGPYWTQVFAAPR